MQRLRCGRKHRPFGVRSDEDSMPKGVPPECGTVNFTAGEVSPTDAKSSILCFDMVTASPFSDPARLSGREGKVWCFV
ncbi:MAG: hypothetical protein ACKVKG_17890 [Alphaproteobacteria bacterium]